MGKITIKKHSLRDGSCTITLYSEATQKETIELETKIEVYRAIDASYRSGNITLTEHARLYKEIKKISDEELIFSFTFPKKKAIINNNRVLYFYEDEIIISFAKQLFVNFFKRECDFSDKKVADHILYDCTCCEHTHVHIILSTGWISAPLTKKASIVFLLHAAFLVEAISEKNFWLLFDEIEEKIH